MKTSERRVQTFVHPAVHRALKVQAAQNDQTITEVVRDLIVTHCGEQASTSTNQTSNDKSK